jgi:Tol biopolymer transport system component
VTAPGLDARPDLDTQLSRWLAAEAPAMEPLGALDEVLAVTAATRQVRAGARQPWRPAPRTWPWHTWLGLRRTVVVAVVLATLLAVVALLAAMLRPLPFPRDGRVALAIDGDIWVADADGRGLRLLVGGPGDAWSPLWSPSGERLAFLDASDGLTVIRLVDADGEPVVTLLPPHGWSIGEAATVAGWSPDGAELTVPVVDGDQTRVAIFEVGTGTATVPDIGQAYTFGWSPDGKRLGIRSVGVMAASTVVMAPDGTDLRTLVPDGRLLDIVSFTDDGSAVLFSQPSGPRSFDGDVVTVRIDDGQTRILVGGPGNDVAPAMSPGGDRLAFHRSPRVTITAAFDDLGGADPTSDLYVLDAAAPSPRKLVGDVAPGSTWSPSGDSIATLAPDGRALLLVPVDGSAPTRVDLPGPARSVCWQPLGP